jgi:site-specific DNA recombinase
MLAYCAKHRKTVTHVVVHNMTRFARDLLDQMMVVRDLKALNIVVRSVAEPFDDSPQGVLHRQLLGMFAEMDNTAKAARTIEGMHAAISDGRFPHKAALGYRNVSAAKGEANLVVDLIEAPLILRAFEMIGDEGKTITQALQAVTEQGLRTRKGAPLTAETMGRILRNEIYTGTIYVKKWDRRSEGNFNAIVSRDLFDRVRRVLQGKGAVQVTRRTLNPRFPLRVFVRCAGCHKGLTGSLAKRRYAYYNCRTKGCRAVNRAADILEREFVVLLGTLQLRQNYLQAFAAITRDVWNTRHAQVKTQLATAAVRIGELTVLRDKLVDALLLEKISQHVYQSRLAKLEDDLALASRAAQDAVVDHIEIEAVITYAQRLLGNFSTLWQDGTAEDRVQFQAIIFPNGLEYSPDTGFRTHASCSVFEPLQSFLATESTLVSPMGFEPMLSP